MTTAQCILILIFFSFTGWFIAWLIIKFLFWPARPFSLAGVKLQGLVPASQERIASGAGQLIQAEFIAYKGLEDKLADPQLIAKLKPQIEVHVDHFLREKIKAVFPIIAQFMGEKTINQFKAALLDEIDNLLPVLLKNYAAELKNEIRLDQIVESKINALETSQLQQIFYSSARKQISRFKLACGFVGLLMGLVTLSILFLFNM